MLTRLAMTGALILAVAGCASEAPAASPSDALVGTWAKTETKDRTDFETFIVFNADRTHQWLGRSSQTVGETTVSTDGPCGTGTFEFREGTLTMTTKYVRESAAKPPTKSTETREESFDVEILKDSIRFNKTSVYKKAARPAAGEYCP